MFRMAGRSRALQHSARCAGSSDAFVVPDVGPDVTADAGPDPTIVPGVADRILLVGTIVTPDAIIEGQLLVEGKLITCVDAGDVCSKQPGASGATIINTRGIIAPGLIDTHNHILFDIFDDSDWLPNQVSVDHTQWTSYPGYAEMLDVKQCIVNDSQGKPAWCANTPYGTPAGSLRCEVDKWGELKGLIAGTTSIVGLPGTTAAWPVPSSVSESMASRKIFKLRGFTLISSRTRPDGKFVAVSPDAGSCGSMRWTSRGQSTLPPLAMAE